MYKKEDLRLLNMSSSIVNKNKVFQIENELSIEEKIKFIDEVKDNVATYLLDVLNKWENEKESLPKDNWGSVKTVSKKAWIKRNDPRKIIDHDYKIGSYYMFGEKYKSMSLICPTTEHGYNLTFTGDNVVNQWFHDLCSKLFYEEKKYFESVDTLHIKLNKVKECAERYSIYFDSKKINDIVWNNGKDITEKELDIYLESYEKLENYINDMTKEIEGKINSL